jgi:endopolyphosphatase
MQLNLQRLLLAAVAAAITATASPFVAFEQKPLNGVLQRPASSDIGETASRKLTGKFLHITGMVFARKHRRLY